MKKYLVWLLAGCAITVASAGERNRSEKPVWSFGFQLPVWSKVRASYSARSTGNPGIVDGTAADAYRDRFYDDGYVRVNSLGNPTVGGLSDTFPRTTFYRYDNASQAVAPDNLLGVPGSVSFHSVNFNEGGDFGDAQANHGIPGLELFVRREIRTKKKRLRLAMEAGVSWSHLSWVQQGNVPTTLGGIADTYNTGTVAAPGRAGVEGVFDPTLAPFPQWIGSTPTRSVFSTPGILSGSRRLTLDAFNIRVGPSVGMKLTSRLNLDLLAGIIFGVGWSQYNYSDTVATSSATLGTLTWQGNDSDGQAWYGLYSALRLSYDFTQKWQGLVEVRHLWSDSLLHQGPSRSAEIKFSDGLTVSVGALRAF